MARQGSHCCTRTGRGLPPIVNKPHLKFNPMCRDCFRHYILSCHVQLLRLMTGIGQHVESDFVVPPPLHRHIRFVFNCSNTLPLNGSARVNLFWARKATSSLNRRVHLTPPVHALLATKISAQFLENSRCSLPSSPPPPLFNSPTCVSSCRVG